MSAALLVAALLPAHAAHAAPTPTCQGEAATIVGTRGDDSLRGTTGDDVIVALGGDDVVVARGGDDLVCGGDGSDTLRGGRGADRLHGEREALHVDRGGRWLEPDLLDGGPGDDHLDVGGDDRSAGVTYGGNGILDFRDGRAAVTLDLDAGTSSGQGDDTLVAAAGPGCDGPDCFGVAVYGSASGDVLLGSGANDVLLGNEGDDLIDGRGGADELRAGMDGVEGPADADVVNGGDGDDVLASFIGRDVLNGDAGDDQVLAIGGGPAEAYGGPGDDELVVELSRRPGFAIDGGAGVDDGQVWGPRRIGGGGRPGAARVLIAEERVVAAGVEWGAIAGLERLLLGANVAWDYRGTDARDVVDSAGTSLRAWTYGGADVVRGTPGPDRIDAGAGTDRVSGGHGRDRCLHAERVQGCERISP